MVGIMTIDLSFVSTKHASETRSFIRKNNWQNVSEEAATWLKEYAHKYFADKKILAFFADQKPQPDTKVVRFRRLSKRTSISALFAGDANIIAEDVMEELDGLKFWCVVELGSSSLGELINYFRTERSSFLFFSDQDVISKTSFWELKAEIDSYGYPSIDHSCLVKIMIERNFVPIRIWGQFDDPKLWIEIYGNGYAFDA
jgi:hypothetical protein